MTTAALDRILLDLTQAMQVHPVLSEPLARDVMRKHLQQARQLGQQDARHPLPRTLEVALGVARRELERRLCCTQDSTGPVAKHVFHDVTGTLAEAAHAVGIEQGREQAADAVRLHHAAVEGEAA